MIAQVKAFGAGFRTLIVSGAMILVGLADAMGSIDISPLLKVWFKDADVVGVVMVVLGVLFGVLRYLTTTPAGQTTTPDAVTAGASGAADGYEEPSAPAHKNVDDGA